MRFYLIDRVTELEKGVSIKAIKCWTQTDDVFNDHFPSIPIVPGVLIVESMAQTLGVLFELSYEQAFPDNKIGVWSVLSIIHKAKFKKFTLPGDRMEISAEIVSLDSSIGLGKVVARVEGDIRAQAELSMALISKEKIPHKALAEQRENTFNFLLNSHKINEFM